MTRRLAAFWLLAAVLLLVPVRASAQGWVPTPRASGGSGGLSCPTGVGDISAGCYVQSLSGANGAGGVVPINGTNTALQVAAANTGFVLSQAAQTSDVAPPKFIISAGGAYLNASAVHTTGGDLWIESGPGDTAASSWTPGSVNLNTPAPGGGSGLFGQTRFWSGGNSLQGVIANRASLSGGSGSIVTAWFGNGISPSLTNYALQSDGTAETDINAITTVGFNVSNQTQMTLASGLLDPAVDNALQFGQLSKRVTEVIAAPGGFLVVHANGDSFPTTQMGDVSRAGYVSFGDGTALPNTRLFYPSVAHTLQLDDTLNGNAIFDVGGTAGGGQVILTSSNPSISIVPASTSVATAGNIRVPNATNIIEALSQNGASNIGVLSTDSSNDSILGDTSVTGYAILKGFFGAEVYGGATGLLLTINKTTPTAMYPGSFGLLGFGTSSFPFGDSYLGASTTSTLGFMEFAAATGTHDTQQARIVEFGTSCETGAAYAAASCNSYTLPNTNNHGLKEWCTAEGRVVSAGNGTFWTSHGVGTSFSCTVRGSGWYIGGTWSSYSSPYYVECECSGGACGGTSSPSNPLLVFNSTTSGTTATVTWAAYNDGGTAPLLDLVSDCKFLDN